MPQAPRALLALPLAALLGAAGCTQMEVEQGNYLSKQQVADVEEGMERDAVRRVLGKPLIQDPFHPDRWDYIFTQIAEDGERTRRRLTIYFNESDQVGRIVTDGGAFPAGHSPAEDAS
ncbi:MAG TPA: outer membrane protein assembly factor BamE [Gammaproteobacteria bacterium]|nr:outer membrane protein assembly factor BamE [Gammaproteobacteria bacterium]